MASARMAASTALATLVSARRRRSAPGGASTPSAMASDRGVGDQIPHLGVLLVIGGPDPLCRDFAEGFDIGVVDHHALGLEQLLGLLQIVDALGVVADALLRLARDVEQQLLLRLGEAVPD